MSPGAKKNSQKTLSSINGYALSHWWFEFAFRYPDKVTTTSTALFSWLCELYNKLQWPDKFGVPTIVAMSAIGIKNYRTYKKAFDNLVEWGFIEVIAKSTNQFTANTISIKSAYVQNTIAKELASAKNTMANQNQIQPLNKGIAHINKPNNKESKINSKTSSGVFTPDYKPNNDFDSIAFTLWKQVVNYMQKNDIESTTLKRTKVATWSQEIESLIKHDGYTKEDLTAVMDYLKVDSFWAMNIRCPSKLRAKFEDLLLRAQTTKKSRYMQPSLFKETEQDYTASIHDVEI
jgi:DNA-binding transcriptional regulator YhcF (GntR family)